MRIVLAICSKSLIYLLVLAVIGLSHAYASSSAAINNYNITATTLSKALIQLSRQSQRAVLFVTDIAANKETSVLQGEFSLEGALDILLLDTGLGYQLVNDRFIIVTELDKDGKPQHDFDSVYHPGLMEYMTVIGEVVTGSRFRRMDYEGSMPVDTLTRPELELRGAPTVAESLKFLPAVSGNSTSTAVTNGGDGSATVTLRGLPASNTLVLINGRRVAADGIEGDAVDLNTISPAAIERIEVLKDGASAIYGADAIAGVVNIVMRNDYEGFSIEQFYGEANTGDLETLTTSLLWGQHFSWGQLFFSASHYDQKDILSSDRSVSESADGRPWGGSDLRSSATPASRVGLADGSVVTLRQNSAGDYLSGTSPADFRPVTTDDLYNIAEQTTAWTPHQHDSAYFNLQYDVVESISVFVEASYDKTQAESQLASTPLFTAFETRPITVAADNIYNPFGEAITDVRRRFLELPARLQSNDSDARRVVLGVLGGSGRWRWDSAWSWSMNRADERLLHLLDAARLQQAVGPANGCTGQDGCVPLNLFGPPGSIDADQLDYVAVDARLKGFSKLSTWNANVIGALFELPAGMLDIAAGIEYRKEATKKQPLSDGRALATIGGANFSEASGERDVSEIYLETVLPLLDRKPAAHALTLELATRHSRYSDFGDTTNPKIGLRWRPLADVLVRTTWSKGFRAPSLNELNKVDSESQAFLVDPCSMPGNAGVLIGCSQQTDPTRLQYLTLFGGNQDLKPEQSTNRTLGLVWTPAYLDSLRASVDFFQIEQVNVVDANAQFLVDANARFGVFSDRVLRDSNGEIQRIIATNINNGRREIRGFDISARYQFKPTARGVFSLALNASHIEEYLSQANPSVPTIDVAGTFVDEASAGLGALPSWKGNIGLTWRHRRWQGNYTVHYVSSMNEVVPMTERQRRIDPWLTHDMQVSYTVNFLAGLKVLLGVDNLFDEEPPQIASAFNDNIDARIHELKGRFMYLRLNQSF